MGNGSTEQEGLSVWHGLERDGVANRPCQPPFQAVARCGPRYLRDRPRRCFPRPAAVVTRWEWISVPASGRATHADSYGVRESTINARVARFGTGRGDQPAYANHRSKPWRGAGHPSFGIDRGVLPTACRRRDSVGVDKLFRRQAVPHRLTRTVCQSTESDMSSEGCFWRRPTATERSSRRRGCGARRCGGGGPISPPSISPR